MDYEDKNKKKKEKTSKANGHKGGESGKSLNPPSFQLKGNGVVQRQVDTVNMDPVTIHSGRGNTSLLSGDNQSTDGMQVTRDQNQVRQSSVASTTPLPFTEEGWNANEILEHLGQFDRIAETDSDGNRCVQTVALSSHILNGVDAVKSYFAGIKLSGMLSGRITDRKRAAVQTLDHTAGQLDARTATYGDLYWAIEAVHALFYKDDRGTPEDEIHEQIAPAFDGSANMTTMDTWCSTTADLLRMANGLQNGEQFMLNSWRVDFNTRFSDETANEERYVWEDEDTGERRNAHIRRLVIQDGIKPSHEQIDEDRDVKGGHQMLIYKDASNGNLMMYDPELRQGGTHLFNLTTDAAVLDTLFNDQPNFEMYKYIQILGKMVPAESLNSFSAP